jgi:hypothetical protein
MSLSPEQRDDLRELLAEELRAAWRTAVADGTSPAALADLVDQRRQAMRSTSPRVSIAKPAPGAAAAAPTASPTDRTSVAETGEPARRAETGSGGPDRPGGTDGRSGDQG